MSTLTQIQRLTGEPALKAFLGTLQPKDGSRELWLKYGHDRFVKASWTEHGLITWQETKGGSTDRQVYGQEFGFEELAEKCRNQNGGAFYIPTQPQGFPLASLVDSTDTLTIEIDQGTTEEQWALYQQFTEVTSLVWSSLLTSGSKSIHGHIKADRHLPLEQAQYLRRLLVLSMQSDPVTVRLHQPMRIPGFHRLEKQSEQALLSYSPDRYSFDVLVAGLKRWFDFKELPFPDRFTEAWWLEFHNTLKGCAKLEESVRFEQCKALLADGLQGFEAKLSAEAAEREQRSAAAKAKRAGTSFIGKSPVDQVNDACADLAEKAFDNSIHKWVFGSGHKARGCCSFHKSASGNSAWIAPLRDGDGWGFHCSACSDDKPINAFGYWWYLQNGFKAKYPSGREYIQAAKDFLNHYGFTFEESKRVSNSKSDGNNVVPMMRPEVGTADFTESEEYQSDLEHFRDGEARRDALAEKRFSKKPEQYWLGHGKIYTACGSRVRPNIRNGWMAQAVIIGMLLASLTPREARIAPPDEEVDEQFVLAWVIVEAVKSGGKSPVFNNCKPFLKYPFTVGSVRTVELIV